MDPMMEKIGEGNAAAGDVVPHDSATDRTLMAEERTFSAWVRTGLTSVATGLAIVKVLPEAGPIWLIRALGVLFVVIGGLAFVLGYWGYRCGAAHWSEGAKNRAIPRWLIAVLSMALLAGSALALALVFMD